MTSDLLSEITQHMWETLYIFAPDFSMFPLLAAALPEISADGRQYTIALRPNATFHDGSVMTADDVIASLRRWGRLSPRGRLPMGFVTAMTAKDKLTLVLELKQPYAPFTSLLGFPNGSPIVMPKRIADLTEPLKEYVGTGPYKLIEYKPDTYVRLREVSAVCVAWRDAERVCRQARGADRRAAVHSGTKCRRRGRTGCCPGSSIGRII